MKQVLFTVHLYFGGERAPETRFTEDIEQAREWVKEAEHGEIINPSGILVQ